MKNVHIFWGLIFCLPLWLPVSLKAETALSAAEFEALTIGKTLEITRLGHSFGAEQYYPNRRVVWAFEGQTCSLGLWYEGPENQICFQYESLVGPQCWTFTRSQSGQYFAYHADGRNSPPLEIKEISTRPIDCPLEDVGS